MSENDTSVWLGSGRNIFLGIAVICAVMVAALTAGFLFPILFGSGMDRALSVLMPPISFAAAIGIASAAIFMGLKAMGADIPNMRRFFRILMIVMIAITVMLFVWLIITGISVDDSQIPGKFVQFKPMMGITGPVITLIFLCMTTLVSGIYLSDTKGAIEPEADGFFDIVSLVLSRVGMILVASIVCIMFFEVISRYFFNRPTLWANELSLWVAGFVFLLAGLYSMQQRSHIRIYIIYDMFPRWLQKASDVLSVFLIWVFTIGLVWGAFNEARDKIGRMETFGTAWDPPLPSTVKLAILVVIALVALQALSNLIADWNKAPEHHSPADEIDQSEIDNIRKTIED